MKGYGYAVETVVLAVLLAGFGSDSVACAETLLVMLSAAITWTGIVTVALVPAGMVPRLQVTVLPVTLHVPSVVVTGVWQDPTLQ